MRTIALCAGALLIMASGAMARPEYLNEFTDFKAQYGKVYASPAEESRRFKIFTQNMKKAAELQAVNPLAKFGANEFADLSEKEFKVRHNAEALYRKAQQLKLETKSVPRVSAPGASQDWRTKGAVTPVKNQGQCGSCWSFSTTGGIEGQWALAGHPLTSVSEQELVSCDTIDHGCDGGLMDNAMQWLMSAHNGTIVTEASYPYVSGGGSVPACSMAGTTPGATINGFKNIQGDENGAMTDFVYANGPLSIAVDAESWQTYNGGIITNCPAGQLDHGVLIVGYDNGSTPPYWIIKNSWGASWGEAGYLRVQKGQGQCSIGQYQCSSEVKSVGPTAPPSPPTPPGPTPPSPPSGNGLIQKTCADQKCQQCTEMEIPTNTCVARDGKSFKAVCASDAVIVSAYNGADCSGDAVVTANPLNTCSIVFEKTGSEHFILNECRSGPAPGPTPTTAAPTNPPPAPTPTTAAPTSGGTFEQKNCQDSACSQGCSSHTFPQNQCLGLSGGGSAIAVCTPTELQLTVYPMSSSCSGQSSTEAQPINQCLQDSQGTYFENVCSSSSPNVPETNNLKKIAKRA